MIPQEALKKLAHQRGVSDTEFAVLSLVMEGQSTPEIAKALKADAAAVRKRLGEVYRKFGIGGKGPGKLPKLQQLLLALYQSQTQPDSLKEMRAPKPQNPADAKIWDGIVEVDTFYGRATELAELERWVLIDRCRVVALIGISGIGKTALSSALSQQVRAQFNKVIWRSLSHAPSLQEILADLLCSLSNQPGLQLFEHLSERISQLLFYLEQDRCLLILDGLESILRRDELAGTYQSGYQDYGLLFKQLAETDHQSCLIVTSAEKTQEFTALEGRKVRALHLHGLAAEEGQAIFKEKGIFVESEVDWQAVIQRYGGNPLALKIASVTIQEVFGGNLSEFLRQGATVFGGIRHLLEQQFERLSKLEKDILYWLTINGEPISLGQLREDLVPPVAQPRLLEALESLGQRSLVERDKGLFSLQPVVMEYAANRLMEQISREVTTGHLKRFNSHALIKSQAKDYLRQQQIRLLLQPLLDKLMADFENETALQQRLKQLLVELRQQTPLKPGYAAGNLLNLFGQLGVDVSGADFSGLTIWQAYLKDLSLHRVNFTGSDLSTSVFAERLGSIWSIAFSPDGKRLATGDTDNQIRLWDVQTGEPLSTWQGHEDWVRSVVFSPNGQRLASGSEDQTIRLWDTSTGQCVAVFQGHRSWIQSIAFSPDGQWLASGSEDRTVRLWRVDTGQCCHVLAEHTNVVRSVAFSPNSQLLASGSSDRTVRLWDVATGKNLRVMKQHTRGIRSVVFSPDGELLASGSSDRTIRLWQVATGDCRQSLSGHLGWVWSVAFSPDGQVLASGGEDQTVHLWQLNTGICLSVLRGHTSSVRSVKFSPDGQRLASGGDDQTVRLWDVKRGKPLKTLQGYARGIRSVAFSPDQQFLASGSEDQKVRLWNIQTGQCLLTLAQHTGRVWSVAFSPDGQTLASGSDDRSIRLWQIETGACKMLSGHGDGVLSVSFSPDGQVLASGSSDQTVRLWNVLTGQCLAILPGHTDWVWSVAFSPDGLVLASGSGDLTVKLWDVATRQAFNTLKGHNHWIRSVSFSPDGQTLASSSVGRMVRLWDVKTGQLLNTLDGFKNGIRSVAFSPDSRILASGSDDKVVRIWDIQSGQCLQALEGHGDWVRSVAFSTDGELLASGSYDEAIRLWEVATGQELKVLQLPRLYEGMNITGVLNLSPAQKMALMALGAIDEQLSSRSV